MPNLTIKRINPNPAEAPKAFTNIFWSHVGTGIVPLDFAHVDMAAAAAPGITEVSAYVSTKLLLDPKQSLELLRYAFAICGDLCKSGHLLAEDLQRAVPTRPTLVKGGP